MTVKKTDSSTESLGGGTLSPLKPGEYKPYTGGGVEALMPTSNLPKFEKFTAKIYAENIEKEYKAVFEGGRKSGK